MGTKTILICAWVLWTHWAGGMVRQSDGSLYSPHRYQPVQAYSTQEACESAVRASRPAKGYDRLVCLPDTVKPQ
jgi:hypothetical protein